MSTTTNTGNSCTGLKGKSFLCKGNTSSLWRGQGEDGSRPPLIMTTAVVCFCRSPSALDDYTHLSPSLKSPHLTLLINCDKWSWDELCVLIVQSVVTLILSRGFCWEEGSLGYGYGSLVIKYVLIIWNFQWMYTSNTAFVKFWTDVCWIHTGDTKCGVLRKNWSLLWKALVFIAFTNQISSMSMLSVFCFQGSQDWLAFLACQHYLIWNK